MIELDILTQKEIVILSGKGGTGKTSVSAAFAHLSSLQPATNAVLVDADVDASNLELVLSPEIEETFEYSGGSVAVIDPESCIACGICAEVCRFNSVVEGDDHYSIDPMSCEGCAACMTQCPQDAITMIPSVDGSNFRSSSIYGPMRHAALLPGAENSGKLVAHVKQEGKEKASADALKLVIIDGPPGIGCPVIAASTGANLAVLVTEPTASGISDLSRVLGTVEHFNLPAMVIINKADIYPAGAEAIINFCEANDIPVIAKVPFDRVVTEAMVNAQPVTSFAPDSAVSMAIREAWEAVIKKVNELE